MSQPPQQDRNPTALIAALHTLPNLAAAVAVAVAAAEILLAGHSQAQVFPAGNIDNLILTRLGYLTAVTDGTETGCLISSGTWYVSGTCATYTATASGKLN